MIRDQEQKIIRFVIPLVLFSKAGFMQKMYVVLSCKKEKLRYSGVPQLAPPYGTHLKAGVTSREDNSNIIARVLLASTTRMRPRGTTLKTSLGRLFFASRRLVELCCVRIYLDR